MSIASASEVGPPWWVWTGWLIAAVLMAAVTGFRRPRPVTGAVAESVETSQRALRPVPLLAVTALLSFCAWLGVQIVYVSVRRPPTPVVIDGVTQAAAWSSATLAQLSLISGFVGWGVAFGLIALGGGVRAIGFGIRRLPNGLLGGTIGIFIALPIVYVALQGTLWMWERLNVKHPQEHELLKVIHLDPNAWVRTAAILAAVVAAPLFEELLFRGCVQGGLRRVVRWPWVGIVVASLLFAAIHPLWTMPPIFVFSVLLGLVYERTRNLWATTIMHALFNAFSIFSSGLS